MVLNELIAYSRLGPLKATSIPAPSRSPRTRSAGSPTSAPSASRSAASGPRPRTPRRPRPAGAPGAPRGTFANFMTACIAGRCCESRPTAGGGGGLRPRPDPLRRPSASSSAPAWGPSPTPSRTRWPCPSTTSPLPRRHRRRSRRRLVVGRSRGVPVAVMKGRVHFYEATRSTRSSSRSGCSGASGSRRSSSPTRPGHQPVFRAGRPDGHRGPPEPARQPPPRAQRGRLGPRFPDMSEAYDRRLRAVAEAACRAASVRCHRGVYVGLTGPSYETPAEIRMFRTLGADAVGMSTVPEVIAARHMGIRVAACRASRTWRRACRRPRSITARFSRPASA